MPWKRAALAISSITLAMLACQVIQISSAPSEGQSTENDSSYEPLPTEAPISEPATSNLPCPLTIESMNVDAIMTSCPTQCELDAIDSDFVIVFEEAADLPPYACQNGLDPGGGVNPRLAVYQALRVISALPFDQPFPWTDQDLYFWLRDSIGGIVFTGTEMSYCCDNQNRIVLRAALLNQETYATWYDPQAGIGLDALVGLIVHEARHANIGGHTCSSDDQTLEELGAWGVQYYLFTWLAEHSSGWLNAEQMTGASYSAQVALERICNP